VRQPEGWRGPDPRQGRGAETRHPQAGAEPGRYEGLAFCRPFRNPDYTEFTDKDGKPLPYHGGQTKMPDGATTTKYVILGVCEGRDGAVYTLALQPYTLLRVPPEQLK